jgi:cbb3-type cytochrome oxidase subunit 3
MPAAFTIFFIALVLYYLFRPSPDKSSFSNERQYRAAKNRVEDKRSYAGSLLVVGLLGGIAVLAIVLAAIAAV